jgi:hypothetical protein
MMKYIKLSVVILASMGLTMSVSATQIAYEGFRATDAIDDYSAGSLGGQDVAVGNSGFGSTYVWYGNTGTMSADSGALAHSALVQSAESGRAALEGYSSGRASSRSLADDPVLSGTYYLSGLVNLTSSGRLKAGEYRVAGFMGSVIGGTAVSFADGLHYGVRNEGDVYYLAAFAGGNIYHIAELPAFATTVQVVLKLEVCDTGAEMLSAWYAADGDSQLTEGFSDVSVETWGSVTDLKRLSVQTGGVSAYSDLPTYFDEIYLGTELADVTSLVEPVPGLVASESFKTTSSADDYTDGVAIALIDNRDIVSGNLGFDSVFEWQNATGAMMIDGSVSLSHAGIVGSSSTGSLQIKPQSNLDRNSNRKLAAVPAASDSYFMSALVYLGDVLGLRDGDYVAMGLASNMVANTASVATGMHLGFRRENGDAYLTAFAGGNTYDLQALDSSTLTNTYQIVLQLDVNAVGEESLSAWVAGADDTSFTQALSSVSVETWTTTNDLQTLVAQEHSTVSLITSGAHFDEFRFGVTLASVTAYTLPDGPTIENMQMVLDGSDAVVCWESNGNGSYALQITEDLVGGTWSNVVEGITGLSGQMCATNSADLSQAFYRVVVE